MTNSLVRSLAKLLVILGCLLAPALAGAQGGITVHDIVLNQYGTPMPGASITLCTSQDNVRPLPLPCTHLVDHLYSDTGLSVEITNPFQADGLGNYEFALAPGTYVVSISGVLITTRSYVLVLASGGGGSTANVDLDVIAKGTGIGLSLVDSSGYDHAGNSTQWPNGLNVMMKGLYYTWHNDTSTGTAANKTAVQNGEDQAVIAGTSVTSGIVGIAIENPGTSGDVQVCWAGRCSVLFDNTATIGHWAIPSSTVAGELHDTGSITETPGFQNFQISEENAGPDTLGEVKLLTPDAIGSGASGGFVNPMTAPCDMIVAIAGGVPSRLPCPESTGTVGVDQILTVVGGATGAGEQWKPVGVTPRFVLIGATTDAVLGTDRAQLVTILASGNVAATIADPGDTDFDLGYYACFINDGTGVYTLTPASATIEGLVSWDIPPGNETCVYNDTTNWFVTPPVGPAAPDRSLQFNNAGRFGASTFQDISNTLGVAAIGILSTDNAVLFLHNVAATEELLVGMVGGLSEIALQNSNGAQLQLSSNQIVLHPTTASGNLQDTINAGRYVTNQQSNNAPTISCVRFTDSAPTGTCWATRDHTNANDLSAEHTDGTLWQTQYATIAGHLLWSSTTPSISSGFGTSPSIASNNGTASFRVNVGTGGTATAGVIGLPTAAAGWNCQVYDFTAHGAHVAYDTVVTASSSTTVTVENQTKSTGAAIAWAASDILVVSCTAY